MFGAVVIIDPPKAQNTFTFGEEFIEKEIVLADSGERQHGRVQPTKQFRPHPHDGAAKYWYGSIKKLTDKIERQILVEVDRMKIEERMAFTRENYPMIREELLKIVYWNGDGKAWHAEAFSQ